jgi:hypothetical protein
MSGIPCEQGFVIVGGGTAALSGTIFRAVVGVWLVALAIVVFSANTPPVLMLLLTFRVATART